MKNKNAEVQSRRDFFKKAAKAALPILGATIVATTPLKAFTEQIDSEGCQYGCQNSCAGYCGGACSYSCQNTCKGTCQGCRGCSGSCSYSCSNTSTGYSY